MIRKLLAASFLFSLPLHTFAASWVQTDTYRFGVLDSLQRSQGITNDQNGNIWFSANQSLIRVSAWNGTVTQSNMNPFSAELKAAGANHIGDIDCTDGWIYAPIEDGSKYQHPFIGVYEARSLQLKKTLSLPLALQPGGVPWVTVDAAGGRLITSQYSQTTAINVYDLQTAQVLQQIPMSMQLNSIQGGKYWNQHLYMTANDPAGGFALFEMNMTSGEVQKILHVNPEITEIEGLTFLTKPSPDISEPPQISDFYILGLTGQNLSRRVNLYHWQKTN
jgi:hypothetical protein